MATWTAGKLINEIREFSQRVANSIAFYPSLLALLWTALALFCLWLEHRGISNYLREEFSILMPGDTATARTMLSTFIGGVITLAVFSFSMVMVILNQAASTLSPRLLPGLITDKNHQIVLGIYLGTIIYCTLILRAIHEVAGATLPDFSIAVAILSTLICLGLFVYFIHNISRKIRIEYVLHDIYQSTYKKMQDLQNLQEQSEDVDFVPDLEQRVKLSPNQYGYFQKLNDDLIRHMDWGENHLIIEVIPAQGTFVLQREDILAVNAPHKDAIEEKIEELIFLHDTPYAHSNVEDGFQQVTEIIVKAMSPGINDPGTAIDALETLTRMLAMRLKLRDSWAETWNDKKITIVQHIRSFERLLYDILAPIRNYCKHDVLVVFKVIQLLSFLERHQSCPANYKKAVRQEMDMLIADAHQVMTQERDLQQLELAKKLMPEN